MPSQYAMYFHYQTNLVDTFRTLFPSDFRFEGNRAIVFEEGDAVPFDSLASYLYFIRTNLSSESRDANDDRPNYQMQPRQLTIQLIRDVRLHVV